MVAFEKSLAGITVPNDELRDPQKTYNPMLVSEVCGGGKSFFCIARIGAYVTHPTAVWLHHQLQARFGDMGIFDWSKYIKSLGVSKPVTSVIVTTPSYFDSMCFC